MKSGGGVKFKAATVLAVNLSDSNVQTAHQISVLASGAVNRPTIARPYDVNIKRIPLIGETVLILTMDTAESSPGGAKKSSYYLPAVGLQGNTHSNALPGSKEQIQPDADAASNASNGNPNVEGGDESADLGPGFEERTDVGSLQPFIGDVMIEGRFGHSLRFGYTPVDSKAAQPPSWSSSEVSNPITILANGRTPAGSYNKFIVEDISDDLSSIWLTSTQKVKLVPSNKLPADVDAQSQFDKPSVILNSDRIILNSKTDWVVLSGAKSVALATPSWAMDMDKLFTIIEGLVQQVADLTAGTATFATGVGPTGPATNVADVQTLLTDLKQMAQ